MSEVEELREVVREAHGAIKDLTRLIKEAREVIEDIETTAAREVGARISRAIEIGLESYKDTIITATESASEAVYARFDGLAAMLLGETKGQRRKHGASLAELIEASVEKGDDQ